MKIKRPSRYRYLRYVGGAAFLCLVALVSANLLGLACSRGKGLAALCDPVLVNVLFGVPALGCLGCLLMAAYQCYRDEVHGDWLLERDNW